MTRLHSRVIAGAKFCARGLGPNLTDAIGSPVLRWPYIEGGPAEMAALEWLALMPIRA